MSSYLFSHPSTSTVFMLDVELKTNDQKDELEDIVFTAIDGTCSVLSGTLDRCK